MVRFDTIQGSEANAGRYLFGSDLLGFDVKEYRTIHSPRVGQDGLGVVYDVKNDGEASTVEGKESDGIANLDGFAVLVDPLGFIAHD